MTKPSYQTGPTSQIPSFRLSPWGEETDFAIQISSTARDIGNTPSTSLLRGGLVMGKITSGGKWAAYNAEASDGTETARGILKHSVDLRDIDGTEVDSPGVAMDHAEVDEARLVQASSPNDGLDAAAKVDLPNIIARPSTGY